MKFNEKPLREVPWFRSAWSGHIVSLDDCPNTDVTAEDVVTVIAYGSTVDDWSGSVCGIAKLRDDRYVGWDSWWDATGSGFCEDAYGGSQDFWVARDPELFLGVLSEQKLELLEFADVNGADSEIESVLLDHWMQHKDVAKLQELARNAGYAPLLAPWRFRWLESKRSSGKS